MRESSQPSTAAWVQGLASLATPALLSPFFALSLFEVLGVDQPLDGRILARLLGFAHGGARKGESGRERKNEARAIPHFAKRPPPAHEKRTHRRALSADSHVRPRTQQAFLELTY